MSSDFRKLILEAEKAVLAAYAPYSKFCVGAAILGESLRIYSGSNIENASYGLTICAERVAAFKAVQDGERRFLALALDSISVNGMEKVKLVPCGACLQVLSEFIDGSAPVFISGVPSGVFSDYLPRPFDFSKKF